MTTEACPNCSNKLNLTGLDPGGVLVCGLCVEVLVIGQDGAARHATAQDFAAFPSEMRAEIESFQKRLLLRKTEGGIPA